MTVGVPVLNGGERFKELLAAVATQANAAGVTVEVLVVDSGSTDGSVEAARAAGARVIEIDKSEFQHGRTRNLIVEEAQGDVVALLTDDAVPASENWLDSIVEGFRSADDVALVFGPQIPLADHPHYVRREMRDAFFRWTELGGVVVQRMPENRSDYEADAGWYAFFLDSNGAVAKWAWREHPYREVPYAEDQLIGREMIEAGYAKVYHPSAAVNHSHDYGTIGSFKRYFDDYRGIYEVLGYRSPHTFRSAPRVILGLTRQDRVFLRSEGVGGVELFTDSLVSLRHHSLRISAEWLAARSEKLPPWLTRLFSAERRGGVTFYEH